MQLLVLLPPRLSCFIVLILNRRLQALILRAAIAAAIAAIRLLTSRRFAIAAIRLLL
jgi:hypothetical protein